MVEGKEKNLYLIGILPIPLNFIDSRNKTLEESFWIVLLMYILKGEKKFWECFDGSIRKYFDSPDK